MPNILDRSFKYVPAAKTDIRKTFKRVIAQQKAQSELPTAKVITTFLLKSRGGK